ncbi:MarC family protein [Balneolales bacterium ANBcel1]|nr:MarC family protein [Balneolales bacterium ANBcel1]
MELTAYLTAITGFFVIIDPVGAALIFHSLVPEDELRYRRYMAFKSVIISILLLIFFGFYGEALLQLLGININSMRIAGGLLLFYTAFNMVTRGAKLSRASEKTDISVFPMTIPLMAGPGALTLAILLFSGSTDTAHHVAIVAAILTIALLTLVLMLLSRHLRKLVGHTGDEIIRRFLGVILAALSIQFIYDGISNMVS